MKSFFVVALFCCGCVVPSGSQVKVKATCFNVLSPYGYLWQATRTGLLWFLPAKPNTYPDNLQNVDT